MKIINLALASSTTAAVLLTAPSALADTLKVSVSKQAPGMQHTNRPHNGMDKAAVKRTFGSPYAVSGPVGSPSITRWRYDKFTVYFEYDTVLHSVLTHAKK